MLASGVVLFVMFVTSAGVIARAGTSEPPPPRATFAAFPHELAGWRGRVEAPLDDKTLAILHVDDYLTRTYFSEGAAAGLYIGYWAAQRQGESIHSPLNCLPGAGWEPVSMSPLTVMVSDPVGSGASRAISVNRYVVQKGLDRELILYWYQSHGRVIGSEYVSKLFLIADSITMRRTDAALVRIMVRLRNDEGAEARAEDEAVRFLTALFPRLSEFIPS